MTLTIAQVDLTQGVTLDNRTFGYVAGDEGGFFFTWMPTLQGTIDSVDVDAYGGDGGLSIDEVRIFLADYLPTTGHGQRLWEGTL